MNLIETENKLYKRVKQIHENLLLNHPGIRTKRQKFPLYVLAFAFQEGDKAVFRLTRYQKEKPSFHIWNGNKIIWMYDKHSELYFTSILII